MVSWSFSEGPRRMTQLEDELAGQQRQLDIFYNTLSHVVDVSVFQSHKEQITNRIALKADVDLLDKHCTDLKERFHEDMSEGLAKKADALSLEKCQQELQSFSKDICTLHSTLCETKRLATSLDHHRERTEDIHTRHERLLNTSFSYYDALELQQKAMAASLEAKADIEALTAQEQRLVKTEDLANTLERSLAEAVREQLSATVSAEMSSEVLHKANAAAIERQVQALDATKAELSTLERRMGEFHAEQMESNEQAIAKQDDWYKEKDHEQYLLAVARKERQDAQLIQALAKKADVSWYEQQKAIIDATQVSLTTLNGQQQELQGRLQTKVDNQMLEKQQRRLQQEVNQARQEAENMSRKLDQHREQLDLARGQLLETIRQVADVEAALSIKAEKDAMKAQNEKLEDLFAQVAALEQRQDAAQHWVGHLQEQLLSAVRRNANSPSPGQVSARDQQRLSGGGMFTNFAGVGNVMLPANPNNMMITQPPPVPSEKHQHIPYPRKVKASPYMSKRQVSGERPLPEN